MRPLLRFLIAVGLLIIPVRSSSADAICEAVAADSILAHPIANDSLLQVRVVPVTFPDAEETNIPSWREQFAAEFDDYIFSMSRGRQRLNVLFVKRPGADSTKAWMASEASTYYKGLGNASYETLNEEIMTQIANTDSGAWTGAEHVVMLHYRSVFDDNRAGEASVGCAPCAPGFTPRSGTTQRFDNDELNETSNREAAKWIAAHEYGHVIGMDHTPGSEPGDFDVLANPGRYDVMRAVASHVSLDGFVPYHAVHLAAPLGPSWLPFRQVITTDTMGLRVPNIRSASPKVFEIRLGTTGQYFLVANHQTSSNPFDAKYETSGLYIWHGLTTFLSVVPPNVALDLESADGKCTRPTLCDTPSYTTPNPSSGRDRLEHCDSHRGSSADAFDGVTRTIFACGTNPSTQRYVTLDLDTAQSVPTSVAFENIRPESGTDNMLVDVYLTPKQRVEFPNGGESMNLVEVVWTPRTVACISNVAIHVSDDSGQSYWPLTTSTANDGYYAWQPSAGEAGGNYRIKIVSTDSAGGTGVDVSDADFTVLPPCPPPPDPCDGDPQRPNFALRIDGGPRVVGKRIVFSYAASGSDGAMLRLFDVAGRRMGERTLAPARRGGWLHDTWDIGHLPSGFYVLRMVANGSVVAKSRVVVTE